MQASAAGVRRGNRRLIIIAALWALLVAQGWYALLADPEPFPAVVMPGFGVASDADGTYVATLLKVSIEFDDGTTLEFRFDEVMNGFRFSAAEPSIEFLFDPDRNPDAANPPPEVITWLRLNAARLGGGRKPESITFCWQKTLVDLSNAGAAPTEECRMTRVRL